jgi:predicted DCC family thiol-disulfide oxidoreductase YuxK
MSQDHSGQTVLFFDGVCGLCNGLVDFLFKWDKKASILFSPLQSEYASQTLPNELLNDFDTVVVKTDEGKILKRSEAIFYVLNKLGGFWKILSLARVLPSSFSDFFYKIISKNRYKIFGKRETCRLPTPQEKSRFIL